MSGMTTRGRGLTRTVPPCFDMDIEYLIDQMKKAQAATALQATLRPANCTEFEFGKVHGLVLGYEHILELLTKPKDDEEEDKPSDGKPRRPSGGNPYLSDLDNAPVLPEQYGRSRSRR